MKCQAELCAWWTGDGCICEVMDLEPSCRNNSVMHGATHHAHIDDGEDGAEVVLRFHCSCGARGSWWPKRQHAEDEWFDHLPGGAR